MVTGKRGRWRLIWALGLADNGYVHPLTGVLPLFSPGDVGLAAMSRRHRVAWLVFSPGWPASAADNGCLGPITAASWKRSLRSFARADSA